MTINLDSDTTNRLRIEDDEVIEVRIGGETAFQLTADNSITLANNSPGTPIGEVKLTVDGVHDNLSVTLSGNTEFTTASASNTLTSGTFSINVGGNTDPINETLEIEGSGTIESNNYGRNYTTGFSESNAISVSDFYDGTVSISTNPGQDWDLSRRDTVHDVTFDQGSNVLWAVETRDYLGEQGRLLKIDPTDGSVIFSQGIGSSSSSPRAVAYSPADDLLYVGFESDQARAYTEGSGSVSIHNYLHSDLTGAVKHFAVKSDTGAYALHKSGQSTLEVFPDGTRGFSAPDNHTDTTRKICRRTNNGTHVVANNDFERFTFRDGDVGTVSYHPDDGTANYCICIANEPSTDYYYGGTYSGYIYKLQDNGTSTSPTLVWKDQNDSTRIEDIAVHSSANLLAVSRGGQEIQYYTKDGNTVGNVDFTVGINNFNIVLDEDTNKMFVGSEGSSSDYDHVEGFRSVAFDPTVSVGGATVSHSGVLNGSTSGSFSISDGDKNVSTTTSGAVTIDVDWDEDKRVQSGSVSVDGSTVSFNTPLASGETVSDTISISGAGSYDVSADAEDTITVTLDWEERLLPTDPSVTINTASDSYTGQLTDTDSTTLSFTASDLIDDGTNVFSVDSTDRFPTVNISFDWGGQDPVVEKKGNNWTITTN